MSIYLATDGSWGDATDLVIIDRSSWTEEDDKVFEELTDNERGAYANLYGEFPVLRPTVYANIRLDAEPGATINWLREYHAGTPQHLPVFRVGDVVLYNDMPAYFHGYATEDVTGAYVYIIENNPSGLELYVNVKNLSAREVI